MSTSQGASCAEESMPVATTSLQNPNKTVMKSSCNDQSHILLKQQLFQTTHELQLLKIHNENLLSQIAQLKSKQQQLKHLNQVILQNLNNKHQQVPIFINNLQTNSNEINLKIQGEFLNKRIQQLEQELYNYRNGVCDSVDRRVKKIVGEFTQQQQLQNQKRSNLQEQMQSQRGKSRVSLSPSVGNNKQRQNEYYETHEHKYYNIEYNNYINSNRSSPDAQPRQQLSSQDSISAPYTVSFTKTNCQKCGKLQQIINDQTEYICSLENKIKHFININSMAKGNQSQLSSNSNNHSQQQQLTGNNANSNAYSSSQLIEQWKLKYLQLLKLYQNLKQQHQLLQASSSSTPNDNPQTFTYQNNSHYYQQKSPNNYHQHQHKDEQHYVVTQMSPLNPNGFKKKQLFPQKNNKQTNNNPNQTRLYKEERDNRETQMLQQITNLVNGLGKNNNKTAKHQQQKSIYCYQKMADKKPRISQISRVSMASNNKLDGSAFTIKQGVNRYNTNNPFF